MRNQKKSILSFGFILTVFAVGIFSLNNTAYAGTPYITSAKVTGPKTITIMYSEAVSTSGVDYVSFTGDLAGKFLSAINGSGTNTISLTLDNNVASGTIGGVTINSSLTSVSTGSGFATTTIQLSDAQPPTISSIAVSSDKANNVFSKTGNVISLSFSASEPITGVSASILGHTVFAGGSGAGPYTVSYTVASGDTQDTVSVTISFSDTAGNTGSASLSVSTGSTVATTSSTSSTSSTSATPAVIPTADFPASIFEMTRVPVTSSTQTPNYVFFSSTPGVIKYSGKCSSPTTMAVQGTNTITLNSLPNGLYTSCYLLVTNSAGASNDLQMSLFKIDTTQAPDPTSTTNAQVVSTVVPALSEVTPMSSISSTTTPSYTFSSASSGNITYGGSCSSATTLASAGSNTIFFKTLANGLYSDCTITVSNTAGGSTLKLAPFTVSAGGTTAVSASAVTSATSVAGCATGALFNTLTGQVCPTAVVQPAGCTPGAVFSATTGQACTVTSTTAVTPMNTNTTTVTTNTSQSSSYQFTLSLRVGSEGKEVTELQKRLVDGGYLNAKPNGYFGPATEKAVKAYQKATGISQLGNVGPATRSALNGQ